MTFRARQFILDFLLLLVTFFWGSTFILVKNAVAQTDVFAFLTIRFSLAFFLMLAVFRRRIRPARWETVRSGVVLGVFLFASFAFQTWGLTITTATNGAFITGLNVVVVPMLSFLLLKKPPAWMAVMGVAMAAVGLYVLTMGGEGGWNFGDLLIFVCAIWIALHVILTGYYAPNHDTLALATWQIGTVAALSLAGSLCMGTLAVPRSREVWLAVGITAVFATVFAFSVQTHAQRFTTPTRTALIFSAEPVFGALFAHAYGAEPLLRQHLIGGGLIFLGMIVAEIKPGMWSGFQPDQPQHPVSRGRAGG